MTILLLAKAGSPESALHTPLRPCSQVSWENLTNLVLLPQTMLWMICSKNSPATNSPSNDSNKRKFCTTLRISSQSTPYRLATLHDEILRPSHHSTKTSHNRLDNTMNPNNPGAEFHVSPLHCIPQLKISRFWHKRTLITSTPANSKET